MRIKSKNSMVIRKPHWFFYAAMGYIVKIISKIVFRLKIDNKAIKTIKGPFVVIGNHASVIDVAFTVSAVLPHRLNIVTSRELFSWKFFKPFINKVGCIPINQITTDLVALRSIKTALANGRNIIIYPEGKSSIDGKGLPFIPSSAAKLLKFLAVPVVLSYNEGAYLTKPRYFKGFRYGKTKITESILFTKEELAALSTDEVLDKIRHALAFNDHVYQQENNIRFRSKSPALGLHYVLYKCPKCKSEYQMRSTKRNLICDACGNNVVYTEYGQLIPQGDSVGYDRIDRWYEFQREAATEEVKKEDFFLSKEVTLDIDTDIDFFRAGEGVLTMNKNEIVYEGTRDNEPFRMAMPLKKMHTIITKNEEGIDLVRPDGVFRFLFKDGIGSTKMGLLVEQLFLLQNTNS